MELEGNMTRFCLKEKYESNGRIMTSQSCGPKTVFAYNLRRKRKYGSADGSIISLNISHYKIKTSGTKVLPMCTSAF